MLVRDRILELLKVNENLTIEEIHEKTGINQRSIRTSINRYLKPNNFIKETGLFRNRYKVYTLSELFSIDKISLIKGFKQLFRFLKLLEIGVDMRRYNEIGEKLNLSFLEDLYNQVREVEF